MARSKELVSLKNHIEHHGVKGMKWGVRKSRSSGKAGRAAPSKLESVRNKIDKAGAATVSAINGSGAAVSKAAEKGAIAGLRLAAKAWKERGGGAEVREVNKLRRKLRRRGASKMSNADIRKLQTRLSIEAKLYKDAQITGDTRYKRPKLK